MIKAIVSDFSRVLLFPRDAAYGGGLNKLHSDLMERHGRYDILEHFELNRDLLHFYEGLKTRCRLVIFTTGTIQDVPELRSEIDKVFEKVYAANDLGWSKKDAKSYELLARSLGLAPEEIIYVDDNRGNVAAAAAAGCRAVLYTSNSQAMPEVSKILKDEKN